MGSRSVHSILAIVSKCFLGFKDYLHNNHIPYISHTMETIFLIKVLLRGFFNFRKTSRFFLQINSREGFLTKLGANFKVSIKLCTSSIIFTGQYIADKQNM